ncbi:hypothetical protein MUP37_02250 [Candidatus Bathyarchaeota archaeon]|nr:hypothetical protein [Candidatus Bathyarchaeota archaeon]
MARYSSKKGFLAIMATSLFLILATFIPLIFPNQVAEANDLTSLRSWVNMEIPYFGANNILVKMTAITIGDHLNQGMWIDEITSGASDSGGNSSTTTQFEVVVTVGRAVIEAEYSADSNTTEFIYTVSSKEYEIARSGDFPYDYWRIGIIFHTNFTAQFDPRMKYCSTPSPYYYGRYNTTYAYEEQGYYSYSSSLEILHPSEFAGFVYTIFLPPIILLGILFVTIISVATFLVIKKKDARQFESTLIAIASAVIVFIPIFQLSTQELKTPFTITWVDYSFVVLLILYIILLMAVLVGKVRNASTVKEL